MPKTRTLSNTLKLAVTLLSITLAPTAWAAGSNYKVIYNFYGESGVPGPNGGLPALFQALAIENNGNLFGAAAGGLSWGCNGPCGVVYEMTPKANGKWRESVLFTFQGGQNGYGEPVTSLALDSQGNLYGGALGGKQGYGSFLYQLSPGGGDWNFNVIEDPGTTIGLIPDAQGRNLYGFWGDSIQELSLGSDGWRQKLLYDLCPSGASCKDGDRPLVPLSWDAKGNLYGTTYDGGFNYPQCYCGVAFQLTPNGGGTWTYHRLHIFGTFNGDGMYPYGGLTVDTAGNVYGTATHGGVNQRGTVFKLTKMADGHWKETIIFDPPASCNCTSPANQLLFDKAGNLYGTAASFETCIIGGNACGEVFKLSPQKNGKWKYSLVHLFRGPDGEYPNGLTMDKQGRLYGTTMLGGKYDFGVVFEITP